MDLADWTVVFAVLLTAYEGWALYEGLDPRWPFVGAAGLILGGAALSQYGDPGGGEVLGVFGFLALVAGTVGAVLPRRGGTGGPPAAGASPEPVDERDPEPDPRLDHVEQQPVPVVDRPGRPDGEDVQ